MTLQEVRALALPVANPRSGTTDSPSPQPQLNKRCFSSCKRTLGRLLSLSPPTPALLLGAQKQPKPLTGAQRRSRELLMRQLLRGRKHRVARPGRRAPAPAQARAHAGGTTDLSLLCNVSLPQRCSGITAGGAWGPHAVPGTDHEWGPCQASTTPSAPLFIPKAPCLSDCTSPVPPPCPCRSLCGPRAGHCFPTAYARVLPHSPGCTTPCTPSAVSQLHDLLTCDWTHGLCPGQSRWSLGEPYASQAKHSPETIRTSAPVHRAALGWTVSGGGDWPPSASR